MTTEKITREIETALREAAGALSEDAKRVLSEGDVLSIVTTPDGEMISVACTRRTLTRIVAGLSAIFKLSPGALVNLMQRGILQGVAEAYKDDPGRETEPEPPALQEGILWGIRAALKQPPSSGAPCTPEEEEVACQAEKALSVILDRHHKEIELFKTLMAGRGLEAIPRLVVPFGRKAAAAAMLEVKEKFRITPEQLLDACLTPLISLLPAVAASAPEKRGPYGSN